jgi:hypothetical protein
MIAGALGACLLLLLLAAAWPTAARLQALVVLLLAMMVVFVCCFSRRGLRCARTQTTVFTSPYSRYHTTKLDNYTKERSFIV